MRATSTGDAARTSLLDVQTSAGDVYYWSDRALQAPCVIPSSDAIAAGTNVAYSPWLLQPPTIKRYRSMQTDTCSLVLQNVSGDTLARDFERILRRSAIEGALVVYRYWNAGAAMADEDFYGTASMSSVSTSTATLTVKDLGDLASTDALSTQLSETCQLVWGEARCGATGNVECKYSFQTCQVQEHFKGISNTFYDKAFAEALASTSQQTINRRRGI